MPTVLANGLFIKETDLNLDSGTFGGVKRETLEQDGIEEARSRTGRAVEEVAGAVGITGPETAHRDGYLREIGKDGTPGTLQRGATCHRPGFQQMRVGTEIVEMPVGMGFCAPLMIRQARRQSARSECTTDIEVVACRKIEAAQPPNLQVWDIGGQV
jgi:hypothetical protein